MPRQTSPTFQNPFVTSMTQPRQITPGNVSLPSYNPSYPPPTRYDLQLGMWMYPYRLPSVRGPSASGTKKYSLQYRLPWGQTVQTPWYTHAELCQVLKQFLQPGWAGTPIVGIWETATMQGRPTGPVVPVMGAAGGPQELLVRLGCGY